MTKHLPDTKTFYLFGTIANSVFISHSQLYYWREASLIKGLKVNKTKLHKGFFTTAEQPSGILTELFPYSKYKMYMVVANREYEGPQSNTVEFYTKEGGRICHIML